MKLQTVNVIELFSGVFESVNSFSDDPEGNKEAESFLAGKLKDDGFELNDEELQEIQS